MLFNLLFFRDKKTHINNPKRFPSLFSLNKTYLNFDLRTSFVFILFPIFFLSACSGGSSRRSSSDASNGQLVECSAGMVVADEEEECRLPKSGHYVNNSGEEVDCTSITHATWLSTPEEGLAEDACPFTCNVSYAKDEAGRACNLPNPGHYANTRGENVPCTGTIPRSASLGGQAVEVTDSAQCPFTCILGYVKDGAARTCSFPLRGHYANAQWVATPCSAIKGVVAGFKTFENNTEAVALATGCPFSCKAGYVKDKAGRACNLPNPGKYANAQGENAPCTGAIPHSTSLGGQAVEVTDSAQCPFTCRSGFVKNEQGRSCDIPDNGKYANAQGVEASCDPITGIVAGFKTFENNIGALSSSTGCPFTCNAGYAKDETGRTCNFPDSGKYADTQGDEQDCDPKPNSNWASNTEVVSNANDCAFTCTPGTTENTVSKTCDFPDAGKWRNGNTNSTCTHIANLKRWIPENPLPTTDSCDFECKAGYKKVGRACALPTSGTYLQADGSEASCSPIPNRANWVASPASTATDCDFTCSAGFEKHGRICRFPEPGKWVDSGVVKTCTAIPHSDWASNTGAVSSANACAFTCKTGFSINGRSCDLPSGHFIVSTGVDQGSAKDCGIIPTSSTGWAEDQSIATAGDCVFTCSTGRKPSGTGAGESCILKKGFFLASGGTTNRAATACGGLPASSIGWASIQADGVTSTAACVFECPTGRTASGTGSRGSCNLNPSHFSASGLVNSVGTSCGLVPSHGTWAADQSSVRSTAECAFTCASGYIKNHLGRSCDIPKPGKYANARGAATDCDDIGGVSAGFKSFENNIGAMSSATGCPFSCNAGYVKDTSGRDCNYPSKGKYGDGSASTNLSCSPITDSNFEDWEIPVAAVAAANACPFTCKAGYKGDVTERICKPPLRAQAISAKNNSFTCAILENNKIKCWGLNGDGQLGLGHKDTLGDASAEMGDDLPYVDLGSASGGGTEHTAQVIASGAFGNHTCAILNNGSFNHGKVKCWGDNGIGQLGLGHKDDLGDESGEMGDALLYVDLGPANGTKHTAKAIATGYAHTCAILEGDSLKCWGSNGEGQLGLGSTNSYDTPQVVDLGPASGTKHRAQAIAAGFEHTCVILKNGNLNHGPVKCWGRNEYLVSGQPAGQLGLGNSKTDNSYNTPQAVDLGPASGTKHTAKVIAAGGAHTCAILEDDSLKCWGFNDEGQLGLGDSKTANFYDTPQAVDLGPASGTKHRAQAIATGAGMTCVILKNGQLNHGKVKCWGGNGYVKSIRGFLGLGSSQPKYNTPQEVDLGTVDGTDSGTKLTAQAITIGGNVGSGGGATNHTCVILSNGKVKCWGNNFFGQLGLENTKNHGSSVSDGDGPMGNGLPYLNFGF